MTSNNFLYGFILSIFCFGLSGQQVNAQARTTDSVPKVLKVGLAGSEPFVFENADSQGIAVEIWDEVANKEGWDFDYVSYTSVDKGLKAVEKGDVDLMVGPISITSQRAKHYRFSQPYYQSSLAIASRVEDAGLWGRIKPFFSMQLLVAVGIFLFILSIVGTLFWLAEHKHSPEQFPKDPVKGIGNGMWLGYSYHEYHRIRRYGASDASWSYSCRGLDDNYYYFCHFYGSRDCEYLDSLWLRLFYGK